MELPAMMNAVRFHEHGGPEVLRLEQAPVPAIGPNDALIKVRCCGLNRLDLWTRQGYRGWQIRLPHILGSDIAGTVVAVGSEAHFLMDGMDCFVHPGLAGGPSLERLRGDDNIASDYDVLGLFTPGGYAEYVRVPAINVFPKPDNLGWEEAAAFPLVSLTAWHMLGARRANLRSGENVLIIGGNSGVGTAAIQLAKARGCRVYATAGSPEKAARCRELGADEVIDHYAHAGQIHKELLSLTNGHGVEVVFEHVGPAVFSQCLKCLKRGGRLVTCGATSGPVAEVDLSHVFAKHLTIMGSFMGSMSEIIEVLPLIRRGQLRPVVDRVFPLAEAADAHRYLASGAHFGKVVLKVGDE
jgi:NADPH:quinone reductase-like Zn-dependent oxidoreductase